ncbi:MAG: Stp1/IreP family PP2C-type Ser/Thr phosphatase [Candidatus Riflebacteria bacterium]|nr:Stp1/IreP family PP2C-type Ser/Thr phosphatase [Candidatus Riflebacteria bacterium]
MGESTNKPASGGFVALGVDFGFSTDVGRVRARNEDNYFVCDPSAHDVANRGFFFAVADGMGGHQGGQTASTLAAEVMGEFFNEAPRSGEPVEEYVNKLIERANDTIFNRATSDPDLVRMGTTLTAGHLADRRRLTLWHIGDCRALLVRGGQLRQVTNDHSLVADQLRQGFITAEEAACHPARNVITRALGTRRTVKADVYKEELEPGDRLLICCDGLHGVLSEDELVKGMLSAENSEAACRALTDRANELGGPDNITMTILHLLRPRSFWNWVKGVFSQGQP